MEHAEKRAGRGYGEVRCLLAAAQTKISVTVAVGQNLTVRAAGREEVAGWAQGQPSSPGGPPHSPPPLSSKGWPPRGREGA